MRHVIFLIAVLALSLSACNPILVNPDPPGPKNARFDDVPMPQGMNYDEGFGHITPSGNIREYTQKLSGKVRFRDVVDSYRKLLPPHGWSATKDEGVDPVTLTFVKKLEQCVVEISSKGDTAYVIVKLSAKK